MSSLSLIGDTSGVIRDKQKYLLAWFDLRLDFFVWSSIIAYSEPLLVKIGIFQGAGSLEISSGLIRALL